MPDGTDRNTELIKSLSISGLLAARQRAVRLIEEAHAKLLEAEEALREPRDGMSGEAGDGDPFYARVALAFRKWGREVDFFEDGAPGVMEGVDKQLWRHLLGASGLTTLMDAEARTRIWDAIEKGEVPELNEANIKATFARLYDEREEMFDRGVLNVFKRRSWDYQTNVPVKFGKRLIVDYFFSMGSLSYERCLELDDLVRVFRVLDDKPIPDRDQGIQNQIREKCGEQRGGYRFVPNRGECDLEYFHVRWFKKGTAHLTFTRPDLVDEMNKIVARHHPNALPPR